VKKFAFIITVLLVYVDDVVLIGNNIVEINVIKAHLHYRSHIKDISPIKYFMGLKVCCSLDGLVLNQRKYCLDLISEAWMLGCKPAITSYDPSIKLYANEGAFIPNHSSFRRLIR